MVDTRFITQHQFLMSLEYSPWEIIGKVPGTPIEEIYDAYNQMVQRQQRFPPSKNRTRLALSYWVLLDYRTKNLFVPAENSADEIHTQWMTALAIIFPSPFQNGEVTNAINEARAARLDAQNRALQLENAGLQQTMVETLGTLRVAREEIVNLRVGKRRLRSGNKDLKGELRKVKEDLKKSTKRQKILGKRLFVLKRKIHDLKEREMNPRLCFGQDQNI